MARLRLARILHDEKKADEALKLLEARHADSFAGLYADLKGDLLFAQGKREEARAAYQLALDRSDAGSPMRQIIQLKLDAVGGAGVMRGWIAAAIRAAVGVPDSIGRLRQLVWQYSEAEGCRAGVIHAGRHCAHCLAGQCRLRERGTFYPAVAIQLRYMPRALRGRLPVSPRIPAAARGDLRPGNPLSGGVGFAAGLILVGTGQGRSARVRARRASRSGKRSFRAKCWRRRRSKARSSSCARATGASMGSMPPTASSAGSTSARPGALAAQPRGVVVERGAVFAGFPAGGWSRLRCDRQRRLGQRRGAAARHDRARARRRRDQPARSSTAIGCAPSPTRAASRVSTRRAERRSGRATCRASRAWTLDHRNVYITDDKNAVVALDKSNGASLWKQDKLAGRGVSAPLAFGRYRHRRRLRRLRAFPVARRRLVRRAHRDRRQRDRRRPSRST